MRGAAIAAGVEGHVERRDARVRLEREREGEQPGVCVRWLAAMSKTLRDVLPISPALTCLARASSKPHAERLSV